MKAWTVFERHMCDGVLLVFAGTGNKARSLAVKNGTWEWEYLDTRVRREKKYDKYFADRNVIECNDDLPAEAQTYYNEEYYS